MEKIEHIGIAVKDLNQASKVYEMLLGFKPYKTEEVVGEHVITQFFGVGESKIELLSATHSESAIAKFIQKRGEGIHHIAFAVDDIYAEMKRLKDLGFTLLSEKPSIGADNKIICFVHPKDINGVLIELCQEIK